jgi:hypothetical protein
VAERKPKRWRRNAARRSGIAIRLNSANGTYSAACSRKNLAQVAVPERRQRVLDVVNGHDVASDADAVPVNLAGKVITHLP